MSPAAPVRILAQQQEVDPGVFAELVAAESAALGTVATVDWFDDLTTVPAAIAAARRAGSVVVLATAPEVPDLGGLGWEVLPDIRFDLTLRATDRSPGLARHVQGRGIDGIRWVLRALHHGARWPEQLSAYGEHHDQYGSLRLPADGAGPAPVVVLLHGGFWRARWQLDLMDALAVDIVRRGMAAWNVEYRSPDLHGWDATVRDIADGVEHLRALAAQHPIDPARVALVGHSAGGQLAVRRAADLAGPASTPDDADPTVRPSLVVQLAGLVDLVETDRRDIGNGAVPTALGGSAADLPQVYAQASPLSRIPLGIPQLVVVGTADSPDLREMSRRYVRAAAAGGDTIELIEEAGDHFTVIDASSDIWHRTVERIAAALGA